MNFISLDFVLFFAAFILLYWLIPGKNIRQFFLLLGSIIFCGWINIYFAVLVVITSIIIFYSSLIIYRHKSKHFLFLSIVILLSILAYFKYFNFFIHSFHDFLLLIGFKNSLHSANIVIPIGISFYIFQAISYITDVYTGKIDVCTNFFKVLLYFSFFPRFIAGPIIRANSFFPQLNEDVTLSKKDFAIGTKFFLIGLIYKGVLADNVSPFVSTVFSQVNLYNNLSLVFASFGYYVQIYFDFAGYSLMAIGVARLLGYTIPYNFKFPYISTSISEFWSRWHISLSTWLRDYIYIPLGGNRVSFFRENGNLMMTMLLGGLWHGASWNFVLWGGLHGFGLISLRLFRKINLLQRRLNRNKNTFLWICYLVIAWTLTQSFIMLCWVPFRADNFNDTRIVFEAFFLLREDTGLKSIDPPYFLLFVPILIDTFILSFKKWHQIQSKKMLLLHYALMGIILAVCLILLPLDVKDFIYVQF